MATYKRCYASRENVLTNFYANIIFFGDFSIFDISAAVTYCELEEIAMKDALIIDPHVTLLRKQQNDLSVRGPLRQLNKICPNDDDIFNLKFYNYPTYKLEILSTKRSVLDILST